MRSMAVEAELPQLLRAHRRARCHCQASSRCCAVGSLGPWGRMGLREWWGRARLPQATPVVGRGHATPGL